MDINEDNCFYTFLKYIPIIYILKLPILYMPDQCIISYSESSSRFDDCKYEKKEDEDSEDDED
jgi:hypothetical protein